MFSNCLCGDKARILDLVLALVKARTPVFGAGAPEVRVVFMDEPGEHELVLRRGAGDAVTVEVWWHDDWKSWKMSSGPGTRKLVGSTTVADVHSQVLSELKRLLRENGETGYRDKWVEHGFPSEELRQLERD